MPISGSGGAGGQGGIIATGGASGSGGIIATGGASGSGGIIGTGGVIGSGGLVGTGGATTGSGGTSVDAATPGTGGNATGGATPSGGIATGGTTSTGGTIAQGCGDGVKAAAEQCDSADLGGKTCSSIGLGAAGTLACASDCTLDTSGCRPILVMFGGSPNGGYSTLLGDTWEYEDGTWQSRSPASSPGARYAVGMASFNGTVVLFGGYGSPTPSTTSKSYLNDTWVWDGDNWTQMAPAHKPSTRYSPAMATFRGKIVLFGGWGGSAYSDTWEWNGSDWIERSPTRIPTGRDGAAMANLGGEKLLMFGAGTETWQWDGDDWSLLSPDSNPSDRKYLKAATLNGGVMLFGGATSNPSSSTFYSDTWRWDGLDWTRLLSSGPPDGRRSFAIGPLGHSVLLFGGYGPSSKTYADTWEWTGSTWSEGTTGPSQRMDVTLAAR